MMQRLEKILTNKKNLGLDFVIHIQNKNELDSLINVLVKYNFDIQFTTIQIDLKQWMEDIGEESNYDTCFRIRNRIGDKTVAYNPSIEHWRMFCKDILEIQNGELAFNEAKYSLDTAIVEAKKISNELKDNYYSVFNDIGFTSETSEKEIIEWLMNLNK